MFSTRVVFALVVLLALSHVGTCLECYTCISTSKSCNDPFKADGEGVSKEQCAAPLNVCQKVVTGDNLVLRGCSTAAICSALSGCHSCTGELCNSSSNIMPSFMVISAVAVIIAKYFM